MFNTSLVFTRQFLFYFSDAYIETYSRCQNVVTIEPN